MIKIFFYIIATFGLSFSQGCSFIEKTSGIEDVSTSLPYSNFIGKKYILKTDCYLVDYSSSDRESKEKTFRKQPYLYIVPSNDALKEEYDQQSAFVNEKKYKELFGNKTIAGFLPKGTKFKIYQIFKIHLVSHIHVELLDIYVFLPVQNIKASIGNELLGPVINSRTVSFNNKFVKMSKNGKNAQ